MDCTACATRGNSPIKEGIEETYEDVLYLHSQSFLDHTNRSSRLRLEVIHRNRTSFRNLSFKLALTTKTLHTNTNPLNHTLLSLTNPYPRIIKFLVRLIRSSRITNLSLQIIMLISFKRTKTIPVSPLGISINIHFYDTIFHSSFDFFLG